MSLPLTVPVPPRTPSPPTGDEYPFGVEETIPDFQSPLPAAFSAPLAQATPHNVTFSLSQPNGNTENLNTPPGSPPDDVDADEDLSDEPSPFNFQPSSYLATRVPAKANIGQRRGHKYKHSSISHQIFQEPGPKAPLRLPASLPIPTRQEGWRSMSREQTVRLAWCFCHLAIAAVVQWIAQDSLSLTALSHLIFYDAIGAFLCAGVEVLGNFEVWKRSSIRQPFGAEVLIGFAMSILLLFMGFDLISHSAGHALAELGDHASHRPHVHHEVSPRSFDVASLLGIASTLVSAGLLKNHARMARTMRFGRIKFLPSILHNPSHLLTIGCSTILVFLPLFDWHSHEMLDRIVSTCIAALMCLLGWQLVRTLGSMLLMSYSEAYDGDVAAIVRDIEAHAEVERVTEAKIWQVNYSLCMANLKIKLKPGCGQDTAFRLRENVTSLVTSQLGAGLSADALSKWEVSTQLMLDPA